jgi:hypothetical protein
MSTLLIARRCSSSGPRVLESCSTSYLERQNLTMRMSMSMRRFTRLTNAFSKMSRTTRRLWHSTSCITTSEGCLRRCGVTLSMEAGVANHVWSVAEIVGLLD